MHERAIGQQIGPQDSTPIIPNTTWEYKMCFPAPASSTKIKGCALSLSQALNTIKPHTHY